MTAGLKPYPTMKNSGLPWIDSVPEHWEVRRIKTLFREKNRRSGDSGGVLLSLTRAKGILPQSEASARIASAEDLSKYKVCRPGDLVMNRMQAWSGMFGLSTYAGLVSPDYSVFEAIEPLNGGKFYEHLFKTQAYVDQFAQLSKGIGSGFNRLYTPDFGALPAIVPPPDEQAGIARFLDQADQRIRRYIRAKQRVIKLLEEHKQAIIDRAVTRGLDPNVRLKRSGVDWLEGFPEHWSASRLKFETTDIVDCLHATPQYSEDGEFPAIRTADIEPGKVRLGTARRVNREQFELWTSRLEPQPGDILYSREGERFGIAALVPDGAKLCISQRMMLFRIRKPLDSRFIMWQLNAGHVYAQGASDVIGATSPHVNIERIKNFWIVVPPLEEQRNIAAYVTERCGQLDTIANQIEREIALVREHRTRLAADVVTGKLDVREAVLSFVDEAEDAATPGLTTESDQDPQEGEEAELGSDLAEVEA